MRAVYINPIQDSITDKAQIHHLANVLRIKVNESIYVFDGSGDYFRAEVKQIHKKCIELCLGKKLNYQPGHNIELAIAWLKKEALENVLNTAVQLGVSTIYFFKSEYSQKQQDLSKERFKKILISAAEQSNHFIIPTINEYDSIEQLYLDQIEANHICFSLKSPSNTDLENGSNHQREIYWIGPEGGFSEPEIKSFSSKGVNFFHLPTPIMRAQVAVSCALGYILSRKY